MNELSTSDFSGIDVIRADTWQQYAATLKHVFLVGNLQRPIPHPFLRREDIEVIMCHYQPGDDGIPHWHQEVDEIEVVLAGRLGYHEIATNTTQWFGPGDLFIIGRGICVQRFVREPARTLAIKIPSSAEKVQCQLCSRNCTFRISPFSRS